MKKIYIVFLFIPSLINAQLVKGVLFDDTNSEPIAFAAVGIVGTTSGTVSNQNGEFSIEAKGSDSIVISHLSYGLKHFKIDITETMHTFRLAPLVLSLDEITVTGKTIPEILNEAILKSELAISSPIYLRSYYREFVKTNDNYTKFSDGIVNYSLEKKGKGKLRTKVWVTDSRAVELYDEKEEEIDWDLTSPLDIQDGPLPSLISNIGKFMNEDEQGKYDFEVKRSDSTNKAWTIISISPKEEIEEMLYEGTIAIDYESGLIMQVEYQLSEYHKQFSKEANLLVIKAKLLDSKTRIHFSGSDKHYNISYVYRDRAMKIWNKKSINDEFRFTSDLIVTSILPDHSALEKGYIYTKKSLYKREISTKAEFWKDSNTLKLTDEQQQVIESLIKEDAPNK